MLQKEVLCQVLIGLHLIQKVDDVTAGAGISVTGTGTKTVTNTTCIFKNIASTGQSTLVADSLTIL